MRLKTPFFMAFDIALMMIPYHKITTANADGLDINSSI